MPGIDGRRRGMSVRHVVMALAVGVPSTSAAGVSPTDARAESAPEESAPPLPAGDDVRVADLVIALEAVAVRLETMPTVQQDYAIWREAHGLTHRDALWHEYVRVRLVFECVRDGGLWQLRWAITNRAPRSDAIWAQWAKLPALDPDAASATAECDELSTLLAHLARRMGVRGVGLFWPQWNHVVTVWTVAGDDGAVRVVLPTSQIFLDRDASLGTRGFDPWTQKTIYEYRRRDVRDDATIPASLARAFIDRAWTGAGLPQDELQAARNRRSESLGGS